MKPVAPILAVADGLLATALQEDSAIERTRACVLLARAHLDTATFLLHHHES